MLAWLIPTVAVGQSVAAGGPPAPADTPPRVLGIMACETLPSQPTNAQAAALTLADLERMALQGHPTLAQARARVTAAQGRQIQAGLYPKPIIGYMGDEIGDDGTAGMQGGFVGQQFITGGKRRLDQAMAGQEIQESQFLWDAQERRVLSDVRLRFYDALVAQRQVELTAELVKIGRQLVGLSQRLLTAQQLSQSDFLQAEIETEESEIMAHHARDRSTESWRRLAAAVSAPAMQPTPLAGALDENLPNYDWEQARAIALDQHPELSAAWARVERAQIAFVRARRENVPNVDVMVSAQHMNTSHSDVAGVQVGFPVPIWNRNQGNVLQADAEWIAARNDVRRVELELEDRLAIAFRRYADAHHEAQRYQREILPRAQQSLQLVTRGYEAGQVDFFALLTSQRTYIRVNLAYVLALAELRRAATMIEGQLLAGSLQAEMGDSALGPGSRGSGAGKM